MIVEAPTPFGEHAPVYHTLPNRVILTQYPSYTGVGKYVHDLMQIDVPDTSTYTMYFKKADASRPFYGQMVMGGLNIPHTSGWFLNSGFQGLAFRNLKNQLKSLEKNGGHFFHYTDFGMKPMTSSSNSVLTLHDFFLVSDKYRSYGYKAQPFLKSNVKKYLKFEHIIADTKHVAEEALDYGFEYRPKVVYPPAGEYINSNLDKVQCRKKHNLPLDKYLVLSISSADPRKNLKAVKETMKMLGDNFKLVRVGATVENAYNFKGLTNEEINELYNACDVFLFPTLDEGLGFPLIEAMSAEIPVVSSDIEAVREISGDAAILVEPVPGKLSKGIAEALSIKDDLVRKGKKRRALFSPQNFEHDLREVYSAFE